MEVTTTDTQKRTRAKSAPAATPKTAAKARKPSPKSPVEVQDPAPMLGIEPAIDRTDMIATTAYFLAEERHFMPGRELDDWLEAERRVHALLNG